MLSAKRILNNRKGEKMLFNGTHHDALARLFEEAEESPSSDAGKSRLDRALPGMTYLYLDEVVALDPLKTLCSTEPPILFAGKVGARTS